MQRRTTERIDWIGKLIERTERINVIARERNMSDDHKKEKTDKERRENGGKSYSRRRTVIYCETSTKIILELFKRFLS